MVTDWFIRSLQYYRSARKTYPRIRRGTVYTQSLGVDSSSPLSSLRTHRQYITGIRGKFGGFLTVVQCPRSARCREVWIPGQQRRVSFYRALFSKQTVKSVIGVAEERRVALQID